MKKSIVTLLVLAVGAVLFSSAAQAGVGGCYDLKPMCMGTHPVCVCDVVMNCYWQCR